MTKLRVPFSLAIGAALLVLGACQTTGPVPEISAIRAQATGFSPNSDGVDDTITLALDVRFAQAVKGWNVAISAESGGVLATFSGSGTVPPASIVWDGKTAAGVRAAEGRYTAALSLDYGRTYKPITASSEPFVLDVTPPTTTVAIDPAELVPSARGFASPMTITADASSPLARIDSWSIGILDPSGVQIRSFQGVWPDNKAVWDGTSSEGKPAEAGGTYTANLTVRDEYGNVGSATASIPVNTVPAASEQSSIRPSARGFWPGAGKAASGAPSTVELAVTFGNKPAILGWSVAIGTADAVRKTFRGDGSSLPSALSWDGTTDSGAPAPEGSYTASLSIDYGNTYRPATVRSSPFVVDVTPPTALLTLDPPAFTPAGRGVAGPITITLVAASPVATIDSWSLDVYDQAGGLVASFDQKWPNNTVVWDGKTAAGDTVRPATTYPVTVTVRDEFGNARIAHAAIGVASIPPASEQTSIHPTAHGFSPNGDGIMDTIGLTLSVGNRNAVQAWTLVVATADGKTQKTFRGDAASPSGVVTWDGSTDTGGPAPEGMYLATLSVDYGKTFLPVSVRSAAFLLDRTPPTGAITADPPQLTPDGKGGVQPTTLTLYASSVLADMVGWKLDVLDPDGNTFASFDGVWPRTSVVWDGTSSTGRTVDPQKIYRLAATVNDEFGNVGRLEGSLAVGSLPAASGSVSIVPKASGLSPNGDGVDDTLDLALSFGQPDAVSAWKVEITSAERGVLRTFAGSGETLPAFVTWHGKTDSGTIAPEGRYNATLTVEYGKVFQPAKAQSEPFVLTVTPPSATVTVSPPLFSPGADGADGGVTLSIDASAPLARISSWSLDIMDPAGHLFQSFHGLWPNSRIVWDGRGLSGDLVESAEYYPVVATIRDEFGNVGQAKATVRVDIFVEKTPQGYRIKVSSIYFESFTASYTNVPEEQAARNVETLDRLAAALKRFPGYRIRIVGHAVSIFWDDAALGKSEQTEVLIPLSQARAAAVKQALVDRGIDAAITETDGVGAADQVVPDSDYQNRWKNRRVEFFLDR